MGDWPILSDGGQESLVAVNLSSTTLVSFTAGNSNSMSSWNQIVAATANAASGFWVCAYIRSANGAYLVDIGIGGAGSEIVIVPNLNLDRSAGVTIWIYIPIALLSGTRIAARAQTALTSGTNNVDVGIYLIDQGFMPSAPMGQAIALGANAAASTGTQLPDPGATAHTKGAWVSMGAPAIPVRWLYAIPGMAGAARAGITKYLMDIAIGNTGSEIVILPNLFFLDPATSVFTPGILGPFPVSIPAGTQISARFQCSSTNAADRALYLTLYGIG